ncbi:MAG: hypothetical protein RL640_1292 [Bacteroidota bacterium]|jgi:hypothetical protein
MQRRWNYIIHFNCKVVYKRWRFGFGKHVKSNRSVKKIRSAFVG